jgi:putative hydrolase of the HAD superfamily
MEKIHIDAIAFDYGNVLSCAQDLNGIERLSELTRLSMTEFVRRYADNRPAYDRGILTGTAYWANVLGNSRAEPTPELAAELIQVDIASWLTLDNRLVGWAKMLKAAGLSLAILSNMPPDILAGLRKERGDWLGEFGITIFSCEVGYVKPEPQIYERLLEGLGMVGSRVLFIDDRDANVQGAVGVGLRGIWYKSFETLNEEVQARFDLPLPVDGLTNM